MTSLLASHETRHDEEHLQVQFAIFSSEWVIFVCPESVGWLHSKCGRMLEFVDSLDFMFVVLHIILLPQRLWSTNLIVAGRWTRLTLRGVGIVLVAIIVGTIIVGTIIVGVIIVFFLRSRKWIGSFEWKLAFSERSTPMSGLKPVRTPVAISGSLGVCIYVPASRHWLISYSPVHLN